MTQEINITNFKQELKALLKKYGATISWECGTYSDTYGIYDSHLEITFNGSKEKLRSNDEYITSNNIKDYKTK